MSADRRCIIVDAPCRHKVPPEIFDMVRSGVYEMRHTTLYLYKNKEPPAALQLFTTTQRL